MKPLFRFVKGQDLYGHPIGLNFDMKGAFHPTPLGGFVSILIKGFLLFFFIASLLRYSSSETLGIVKQIRQSTEAITIDSNSNLVFFAIRKQLASDSLEEWASFIDISFSEVAENRELSRSDAARTSSTRVPSKACSETDFFESESIIQKLSRDGFALICPDFGERTVSLADTNEESRRFQFEIRLCENQTESASCNSTEESYEFISDLEVQAWTNSRKIDSFDEDSTYRSNNLLSSTLLSSGSTKAFQYGIRRNQVQKKAAITSAVATENSFLTVEGGIELSMHSGADLGLLYSARLVHSNDEEVYQQQVFGFFDLIATLGGVKELAIMVIGFFLFPVSKHSFYLQATKRLYLARTSDAKMFRESMKSMKANSRIQVPKAVSNQEEASLSNELKKHRVIKIRLVDSIRLFFCRGKFPVKLTEKMWPDQPRFEKILRTGIGRIDNELNLVKVIKNLREMKILLRNSIMDDRAKFLVRHSQKKIIDLDASSSFDRIDPDTDDEMAPAKDFPIPLRDLQSPRQVKSTLDSAPYRPARQHQQQTLDHLSSIPSQSKYENEPQNFTEQALIQDDNLLNNLNSKQPSTQRRSRKTPSKSKSTQMILASRNFQAPPKLIIPSPTSRRGEARGEQSSSPKKINYRAKRSESSKYLKDVKEEKDMWD